jgi:hypothetical protein
MEEGEDKMWLNIGEEMYCGKNFRIFRDAADQTLPVTEFFEIYNLKIEFSDLSRNIQLQVTFGLLHL